MKKLLIALAILFVLFVFGGTLVFLYKKSQAKPVVYEIVTPTRADIVKKTVATGSIVPRKEVELKPRVSGIVSKILVEPGDQVKAGDLVATIDIVPDTQRLTQAQAAVRSAKISADNARNELARADKLKAKGLMPESEYNRYKLEYELRQAELAAAQDNLQVIRKGASRAAGKARNTEVRSTVAGTVLDVPVKEGMSVIESNNFNAGSTIAVVADMSDMIFEGTVDESEVGKLRVGMPLDIRVGALDNDVLSGTLEYIAPKGVVKDGAIQFQIRAAIQPKPGVTIRAGYSANADIVLDKVENVLAIDESVVTFDGDKAFVEIETAPQTFERREVQLGLSDGIRVEVKSGIDESARLKGREKTD